MILQPKLGHIKRVPTYSKSLLNKYFIYFVKYFLVEKITFHIGPWKKFSLQLIFANLIDDLCVH